MLVLSERNTRRHPAYSGTPQRFDELWVVFGWFGCNIPKEVSWLWFWDSTRAIMLEIQPTTPFMNKSRPLKAWWLSVAMNSFVCFRQSVFCTFSNSQNDGGCITWRLHWAWVAGLGKVLYKVSGCHCRQGVAAFDPLTPAQFERGIHTSCHMHGVHSSIKWKHMQVATCKQRGFC